MCAAEDITRNVLRVTETLAGTSIPSSEPLKIVVDKVSVVLEELRTLHILADTHSDGLGEQMNNIDRSIQEVEQIFDKMDKLSDYIAKSKENLDKLEKLANIVERH